MRLKHALKLSSVAIITIMLFPSIAKATIYQMYYPPWRYYWDIDLTYGWLRGGYAKAESEQYPSTGYWKFYLKAQSVVWIAHSAIVYGAMGYAPDPANPYETYYPYVKWGQTITITMRVYLKGYLYGSRSTGYTRLRIYIWLQNMWGGDDVRYLVDEFVAKNGIYIGLDQTRTYQISHKAQESGHYRVSMYLDVRASSGWSGYASVDFKYYGRYIQLEWIEFKAKW